MYWHILKSFAKTIFFDLFARSIKLAIIFFEIFILFCFLCPLGQMFLFYGFRYYIVFVFIKPNILGIDSQGYENQHWEGEFFPENNRLNKTKLKRYKLCEHFKKHSMNTSLDSQDSGNSLYIFIVALSNSYTQEDNNNELCFNNMWTI